GSQAPRRPRPAGRRRRPRRAADRRPATLARTAGQRTRGRAASAAPRPPRRPRPRARQHRAQTRRHPLDARRKQEQGGHAAHRAALGNAGGDRRHSAARLRASSSRPRRTRTDRSPERAGDPAQPGGWATNRGRRARRPGIAACGRRGCRLPHRGRSAHERRPACICPGVLGFAVVQRRARGGDRRRRRWNTRQPSRRGGARIDAGTRRRTRRHLHDHATARRRNARPRPDPSPRGVNEKPLRVLIADDHPLFRNGLRTLFETTPDIELIDAVSDGAEVVRVALETDPDVILMDIRMPELNGIDATRKIIAKHPETGILVLTMFEDDDSVFAAMRAGARGYLLKGSEQDEVLRAIRAVAAGEAIFAPAIAARLIGYFSTNRANAFPQLTEREQAVR